jgi:SAM-dependent methyltransferase
MLQKHSDLVMSRLKPTDVVLDIGGWAHAFNRANYVMDAGAYATRGYYNRTMARANPLPPLGGEVEYFDESRWIQRDICSREPYPFANKQLDYVICSHVLEDVRDPLWVCSEMIRIGKAGYIEVPSRVWETCRGREPGIAGLSHHRWLVEIEGNKIRFLQKFHRIHNWRLSLPDSLSRRLSEEQSVSWLFWTDSFDYEEPFLHGEDQIRELSGFVDRVHPYSTLALAANDAREYVSMFAHRVKGKLRRTLGEK